MATRDEVFEFARQEALRQGVSPELVLNIVRTESGGRVSAVSNKGARGPMQLMPATAKELGVNPDDWRDNIRGGVRYIGQMLNQFQDPVLAVAAYNAGPGAVRRAGGVPNFQETQNYVQKVLGTNMATRVDPRDLGLPAEQQAQQAQQAPASSGFTVVDPSMLGPVGAPATQAETQPTDLGSSITRGLREFGRQVGLTGRMGLEGVGTVLDIGGAPISSLINLATGQQTTEAPSQSISRLLTQFGVPQPQNELERGVQAVGRAVTGAATGVGAGRLLAAPVQAGLSGQTATQAVGTGLATQPLAQLAGAATGATAAETARGVFDVQDPYALAGLSLLGNVAGGATASRLGNVQTGTRYADELAGATIESGRRRGVTVDAGDVGKGGQTIRGLRSVAGTAETAQGQRQNEVATLINRTAAAARPEGVRSGSEAKAVAQDLRQQYNTAKRNVNPLFQQAEKLAGNQPIQVTRAQSALNDVVDQFPDTSQANIIARNIERLQGISQTGGTYKEIRDISANIGSELSRVQKGIAGGSYNERQQRALAQLMSALDEDVAAWAAPRTLNGRPVYTPAGAAHERAMEQFRTTVAPFRRDQDIYRLVSSKTRGDDYDRAAEVFSNKLTNNTETANLSMDLMSPKGQQAAQYQILNDARSAALAQDPKMPSIDRFNQRLNLGLPDNPTPQQVILSRNPELLDEVSQVRDVLNTVRPSLVRQPDSPVMAFAPSAGRAVIGGAATGTGIAAGLEPTMATGLGLTVGMGAPRLAGMAERGLTSLPATRFMLGQGNLGTAGATALTAEQLAEMEGRAPSGLFGLIGEEPFRAELRGMAR